MWNIVGDVRVKWIPCHVKTVTWAVFSPLHGRHVVVQHGDNAFLEQCIPYDRVAHSDTYIYKYDHGVCSSPGFLRLNLNCHLITFHIVWNERNVRSINTSGPIEHAVYNNATVWLVKMISCWDHNTYISTSPSRDEQQTSYPKYPRVSMFISRSVEGRRLFHDFNHWPFTPSSVS